MNLEHFHVCPEAAALAAACVQRENHPLSHYSKEGFLNQGQHHLPCHLPPQLTQKPGYRAY